MIRVAIVHYHLRSGGVSRVIEHAVASLKDHDARAVVLAGEQPTDGAIPHDHVRVVDGIDYAVGSEAPRPDVLAEDMQLAAREALGGPPDIWHFHNHSMGKNCALTRAVSVLARAGHRILLQIHDFAEDGRPHLFTGLIENLGGGRIEALGPLMYPQAPHIHYATINGRDGRLLAEMGVPPERLHLIPNAVTLDGGPRAAWEPNPAGPRLVLYPVRAIRRKNLGEFLLWAALAGDDTRFAVTLAPKSPADRVAYERWVAFAKTHRLPAEFEVGTHNDMSFEERLGTAWVAASTSVAEGFGLTFLEPWLVNRPVTGRALPEITRDFTEAGVDLSAMYDRLLVPLDWVGKAALREKTASAYRRILATYGRTAKPEDEARAFSSAVSGARVDFGRLDEELQERVLARLQSSPGARDEIEPRALLDAATAAQAMDRNRAVIQRAYSLERYGERLMAMYRAMANSAPGEVNDGLNVNRLLDAFLAPERFCLLRT